MPQRKFQQCMLRWFCCGSHSFRSYADGTRANAGAERSYPVGPYCPAEYQGIATSSLPPERSAQSYTGLGVRYCGRSGSAGPAL